MPKAFDRSNRGDTYCDEPNLATLVRDLPWTHNLLIMSRSKRHEQREFYLRICLRERWGKRELERQLAGALFERTVLSPPELSPVVAELHPAAHRHVGPVEHHVPQYAGPRREVARFRTARAAVRLKELMAAVRQHLAWTSLQANGVEHEGLIVIMEG